MDLVKTGNAWNVIEEIVHSKALFSQSIKPINLPVTQNDSPSISEQIEEKLLLLFEYIDGRIETHYEEKIFNIFSTLIKKNRKVSILEVKLL